MTIDNDTRGWIMTCVSGIGQSSDLDIVCADTKYQAACVLGAGIICIDVVVRLFPGKKQFKIQDSHVFLSASLSLSFGVMVGEDCRRVVEGTADTSV